MIIYPRCRDISTTITVYPRCGYRQFKANTFTNRIRPTVPRDRNETSSFHPRSEALSSRAMNILSQRHEKCNRVTTKSNQNNSDTIASTTCACGNRLRTITSDRIVHNNSSAFFLNSASPLLKPARYHWEVTNLLLVILYINKNLKIIN